MYFQFEDLIWEHSKVGFNIYHKANSLYVQRICSLLMYFINNYLNWFYIILLYGVRKLCNETSKVYLWYIRMDRKIHLIRFDETNCCNQLKFVSLEEYIYIPEELIAIYIGKAVRNTYRSVNGYWYPKIQIVDIENTRWNISNLNI